MHDLTSLRKHLLRNNVDIKEWHGYVIKTKSGDTWDLCDDIFYKNGVAITLKDIYKLYPKRT